MSIPKVVQIKILSTPEFIQELKNEATNKSKTIKVLSSGVEKDPTALEFGLDEVATMLAIIQGSFYIGEFCSMIWRQFKDGKAKRVVIQTPLRRVEIILSEDLTEDSIRSILKKAIDIAS